MIGIITERHAEDWKVDIACHQPATLSMYSFENATRRNRPNLNVSVALPVDRYRYRAINLLSLAKQRFAYLDY